MIQVTRTPRAEPDEAAQHLPVETIDQGDDKQSEGQCYGKADQIGSQPLR